MALSMFSVVLVAVLKLTQASNHLGRPLSILHGLKPAFPTSSDFSSVLYPVTKSKLLKNIQTSSEQNDNLFFEDFLKLTYHPNEKDLLKTFFSIWQFEGESWNAAAFTYQPNVKSDDQNNVYSKLLGISNENMNGKAYVLARYWKKISTKTITTASLDTLKKDTFDIKSNSNQISEMFSAHGTHYLSSIEEGDMIYQVFVYDKDKTDDILQFDFENPRNNFGPRGFAFRQFTQLRDQGTNGFCREAGKVLIASGDPAFQDIIPLLNDDVYKVPQSIFMFSQNELYKQMEKLTKTIPIKISFKPIIDKLVQKTLEPSKWKKWNDILSATTFQKFGAAISPNFNQITSPNLRFYDNFNPDLVTSTATNYVAINRLNFILDDFYVLNPKFVSHVFIFADVLEIRGSVNLPGSSKIYLICREFVSTSSGKDVPEIIVGSEGDSDPTVKIVVSKFRGVLKVTEKNSGTHVTYAGDQVYKTVDDPGTDGLLTVKTDDSKKLLYPDKATVPELYDTQGQSHEAKWLLQSITNSFELTVTTDESIISVQVYEDSVNTARDSLEWVVTTLNASSPLPTDLEMVLGRALLITKTKMIEFNKRRVIVPRLTFPQYKEKYNLLLSAVSSYENKYNEVIREINQRRLTETISNSLQELNTNVKEIGSFLVKNADVSAEFQDDVANTQQKLHNLEKDRISREKVKANAILNEITTIQDEVDKCGQELKAAIEKFQTEQIFSLAFDVIGVAGSLFTGGVGLANVPNKIKGMVRLAEKIKNVIEIIKQIQTLYESGRNMRNDIGTVNRALGNFPSGQIDVDDFPTTLEWTDFDNQVTSYTSTSGFLPGQVAGEAHSFQQAAKKLSSRGREYIRLSGNIANMQYKQIQIELERDLANRQSTRLRKLKTTLNQKELSENDVKTTDLFELGNIIKMRENQVRSQLIQAFVVMDNALQYHYLQRGTLLTSYDTMAIQRAATDQIQSSIDALGSFPSQPKDIKKPKEYVITNVPISKLLSDEGYRVEIPLASRPFREYVRVRIRSLEVRVDNIESSQDDTAYVQAISSGDSFADRDLQRNPRIFSTSPVEYRTVYNIDSGDTIGKPSEEFASQFIKMTPFDNWVFRIPNVTTNEGLQFKNNTVCTNIRMKFFLQAIFHPGLLSQKDRMRHGNLSDDVLGSKDRLLTVMQGRSLVGDWDAIMAVNAERVNKIWEAQYNNREKAGFLQTLETERAVVFSTPNIKSEMKATIDLGPPKIEFLQNNNDRATLKIKIKSARMQFWDTIRNTVDTYDQDLVVNANTAITATMRLSKLRGELTDALTVVLDLSDGVFDIVSLTGLDDNKQLTLRNQIQIIFTQKLKDSDYELANITFEQAVTPAGFVPEQFFYKTGGFGTDDKPGLGTLYIFFKTHFSGSIASENSLRDFNDPLTIEDQIIPNGKEVALFISNKVVMDEIKQNIYNKFRFELETKVLPGQDISKSQQSVYVVGKANTFYNVKISNLKYDRSPLPELTENVRIPGSTLSAKLIGKGGKIKVHWVNNGFSATFSYPDFDCPGMISKCRDFYSQDTVSFSTSFIKTFQPEIDQDFTIKYNEDPQSASASSSASWTTYFTNRGDFHDVQNQITNTVNSHLQGLSFNFRDISVFAITQVAFPNQKAFRLEEVYIPGDMVILGTVDI